MADSNGPNVVWVTLDSVRQDHTTVGGYERDTTPNLQRLASSDQGEAFDHCIATDKWSLSSTASMFTGTYPAFHRTGYDTDILPESVDTVAERFAAEGWTTCGLSVNQFFDEATGLDRGFDRFTTIDPTNFVRAAGPKNALKYVLNLRRHSAGFALDKQKHRPDYLLQEVAKDRLSKLAGSDSPFLLALHYHGAHIPYYPPLPYQEAFADELDVAPRRAADIAFEHTRDVHRGIGRAGSFDDRDWTTIVTMYDSLVKYSDALVGDLFDHAQGLDLGETVFVVTADHGDLLGEHGLLGHQLVLHDALVHVPMVVHGLDELVGKGDELVQHPDVVRTLAEVAGVTTKGFQGIDFRTESRKFAVSQRGAGGGKALAEIEEHDPDFDRDPFFESEVVALRTREFKYQRSGDDHELFELPDETTDVSDEHSERVERFDERLVEWLDAHAVDERRSADAEFDDATKQRLIDLGYLVE